MGIKEIKRLYGEDSLESNLKLNEYFELGYTKWEYLNGVEDSSKIIHMKSVNYF